MRPTKHPAVPLLMAMLFAGAAAAQDLFVYPTKGQSAQEQEKDEYDCYSWAKQRTGFDPAQGHQASTPPPSSPSVGRTAVRGAVAGSLIGGIADDDWGKGAAVGALAGGIFGGVRKHDREQRYAQQETARYNELSSSYNRAYAACLEGRGYTVK